MYNKKVYKYKFDTLVGQIDELDLRMSRFDSIEGMFGELNFNEQQELDVLKKQQQKLLKQLGNLIRKKVYIASSYDNHWLVIINDLQVARVKNYKDIDTSKMRHEQVVEWETLNDTEQNFLKHEIDTKNKGVRI